MILIWNKTNEERALIISKWWQWDVQELGNLKNNSNLDFLEIEESELPTLEINKGIDLLYINPQTKELWYEYEGIIEPESELEQRIADLELALAEGMEVIA